MCHAPICRGCLGGQNWFHCPGNPGHGADLRLGTEAQVRTRNGQSRRGCGQRRAEEGWGSVWDAAGEGCRQVLGGGGEVQDAPRFLCPLSRVSSPRMKGEQVDTIPPAAPCPAGEELSPSPGSEPQ